MLLYESRSSTLINKSKRETPTRYKKRLNYVKAMRTEVTDASGLSDSNDLDIYLKVNDYRCKLTIVDYKSYLNEKINKDTPKDRYPLLIRASLKKAFKLAHVKVSCSCPDFRYRFAYMATKKGYNSGSNELRPAKITNPRNRGGLCKHLIAILNRPSKWQGRVVTAVSRYIKSHGGEIS